jgi:hypothetical protein
VLFQSLIDFYFLFRVITPTTSHVPSKASLPIEFPISDSSETLSLPEQGSRNHHHFPQPTIRTAHEQHVLACEREHAAQLDRDPGLKSSYENFVKTGIISDHDFWENQEVQYSNCCGLVLIWASSLGIRDSFRSALTA